MALPESTALLTALLSAYSSAITALIETHPRVDLLRPALAKALDGMPQEIEDHPEAYGIYRATLEAFQRAIPAESPRSD